nr:zinc finger, CCHC-type [Tanacetum cinerariifolium]
MAATMKHMASSFAKLENFEMVDLRRWQKKIHFMLSSMSVGYVLTTPMPEDGSENPTVEQVRKRAKWDNGDYVFRGLILNGMSDSLFDIYQNVETFKEPWDTLEAKYMAEDASSKKFIVSNFTNYKITDSRPVLKQYNELLRILRRFTQHKMNMDESIQVSCIIDKLPPSWKDFKHTLKHLKEELTLIELGSHLRIEESLKVQDNDKPKGNNVAELILTRNQEVTCWKCGKLGHLKKDYKASNVGNRANGSSTKGSEDGSSNPLKDRYWFKTYELLNDGSIHHMGNESTALVHGHGYVELRLGHVHFKRRQDMSKDGLILAINMDTEKCKTCMLTKITKKPFQNVKRETKVLELIHNDLCDLHATPSLGNKKYFVTFIDDAYRFYVIKPNDLVSINSVNELRYAIFDEHRLTDEIVQQFELQLRKSKRHKTPKDFGPEFQLYLIKGTGDEDVAFWKKAINDEMDSIIGNNTWVLTDLPLGCRPMGCKWIFKRKLEVDGTIKKFKARLVIQGFKQKSGIDYFDTYAAVTRISTTRLLIVMASIHNLIIHQMDVKTTFLNGELEEKVYMNQPLGFIMPVNENKVYLTKKFLSSRFSMKDMGEADVILGIRIKHKSNGIAISQSQYIKKVLKKFNYSDCTPVSTPLDTYKKLMPNRDIAFAMGKLSRYTSNLGTQHWQAIQRVLKYLKKTMNYRLVYFGYPLVLEGYTDASWISNTKDNLSTSGWVFLLGGATGKEAEWLKNLLLKTPLWVKPIAPISIRGDSAATLAKAYSQMYNGSLDI